MKPTAVVDEMFPEGVGQYMDEDGPGGTFTVDSNREGIHAEFNNSFGDIFDDDDIE